MSGYGGYQSWEQREANADRTRAEAAKLAAEAQAISAQAAQAAAVGAVQGETAALREQLTQARLQGQLSQVNETNEQNREEQKDRKRRRRLDDGTDFKRIVWAIVIFGLVAALPAQIKFFLSGHGNGLAWLLLPVPFFLELLAWGGIKGTQWAHHKGLPRWPFWILTAVLAGFAAFINATHGIAEYGLIAGIGLASTSFLGPVMVEFKELLEGMAARKPATPEERIKERKEAEKKRAQEARIKQQDEDRRKLRPAVWKRYLEILAEQPLDSLTRDQAWAEAWADVEGGKLGLTAGSLAQRIKAQQAIDKVLADAGRSPESAAVDLLLGELFPADPDGDDGPAGGPSGGCGDGPRGGGDDGSGSDSTTPPKGATALGRKRKRLSDRKAPKVPVKPLDPGDLDKVRALADALGGASKLSLGNVRSAVGGGANEYLTQLRDAVRAERRNKG
ncbi:hypothetical protein ABZ752_22810 [Streptomyces roseifaciens]